MRILDQQELSVHVGGSTLATIAIIGTASILTVAAYKLFESFKAKITLPGGFGIEWQTK